MFHDPTALMLAQLVTTSLTDAETCLPFTLAVPVISVVPGETPVAWPDDDDTVATLGFDEAHVVVTGPHCCCT
jgi:hypothetical protein